MGDPHPLALCSQKGKLADQPSRPDGTAPSAVFSIVIPCFNQGRFLVDCLESLVCQSEPPGEVIVVDDGSTDPETIALLERLPNYLYPFSLSVVRKTNGGASSARNRGMELCRGDFILPLDADDKLTPLALESFRRAFQEQPQVDVLYPDVVSLGNTAWFPPAPDFNKWWMTQGNLLVSASAIRRRVFDLGFRFDERMRQGLEDWEFWLRTCVLGPCTAAPLRQPVLYYRQWGHSVTSAVNQQQVETQIRSLLTAAGLWSDVIANRLRKDHAPSHCVCTTDPARLDALHDLRAITPQDLAADLAGNETARFLWVGTYPAEWIAAMQLAVNEFSERRPAAAYVFTAAETQQPYGVVFDRFWTLRHPSAYRRLVVQAGPVISIETTGTRYLAVQRVRQQRKLGIREQSLLPEGLRTARNTDFLPPGHDTDPRISKQAWFFLERPPERPRRVVPVLDQRVLVIALASLAPDAAGSATLDLLTAGALRRGFDQIVLLTFDDGNHPEHARFEPLVDSILHLGNLGLDDEAKAALCVDVCRAAGATDVLLNNAHPPDALIPRLRAAGGPLRILALVHPAATDYASRLAMCHANQIDRVASTSAALTECLTDELYFPRDKIRTFPPAEGSRREGPVRQLLDWLFEPPADRRPTQIDSGCGEQAAA